MKEIPYKYIALGILIGYLSPYVIALIKSCWSPSQQETNQDEFSFSAV